MSNEQISIILARAYWCGHCQKFELIYNKVKKIYKEVDYLNNLEIKFEDYDIANDDIKKIFMINHYDIKDKIEGYPTVFINFKNKNKKINQYFPIEHTVIDENINKNEQHEEAAKRFMEKIINVLKSNNSDNKILYLQKGGNIKDKSESELKHDLNEEIYKNKYQKYKLKYLKLKN